MDYFEKVEALKKINQTNIDLTAILKQFYASYKEACLGNGIGISTITALLEKFLDLVEEQLKEPYHFEPYHVAIKEPFDYYKFGLDFFKPLVMLENSTILNLDIADEISAFLSKGDNVILLANHQTEPDAQAINILLEKTHPKLAQDLIFIAGHRVITDPLCAPFSMGRNLLCIYSKKYIKSPPEKTLEKQQHNQRTMTKMKELLTQGGQCIYVAPSGGRDRLNSQGNIEVAKFDPQSIELFFLLAKQAKKKTHFYPLTLSTYDLLPPPDTTQKELGEQRHAKCTPIHLAFNKEIDMENFPHAKGLDKKQMRDARAEYIWNIVNSDYQKFNKDSP